jgi:hypothetical protein
MPWRRIGYRGTETGRHHVFLTNIGHRIAKMKYGTTHLAFKIENAVDMESRDIIKHL